MRITANAIKEPRPRIKSTPKTTIIIVRFWVGVAGAICDGVTGPGVGVAGFLAFGFAAFVVFFVVFGMVIPVFVPLLYSRISAK